MNLSNTINLVDPGRGYRIAGEGVELALRAGELDWAAALAGNAGFGALLAGEWDAPLRHVGDIDRPYLTQFSRGALLGPAAIVATFRGQGEDIAAGFDFDRLLESASSQNQSYAHVHRAMRAYARGELTSVHEDALLSFEQGPYTSEAVIALGHGIHALTWLRARDPLATLLEQVAPQVWVGDWFDATTRQGQAALAALDGHGAHAEREYRAILETWRRMGVLLDIATAQMEMLRLLGDRLRDRDALAADARRILTDLGAVTLLARLREVAPIDARTETAPRPIEEGMEVHT
jgi:hypothetical protein